MNHFFDRYDLYLTPATATVAPKNGEIKIPKWQKPILKKPIKTSQSPFTGSRKTGRSNCERKSKMGSLYPIGQYHRSSCDVCSTLLESGQFTFRFTVYCTFAREDLLMQLANQLEQAQPWFNRYSEIQL